MVRRILFASLILLATVSLSGAVFSEEVRAAITDAIEEEGEFNAFDLYVGGNYFGIVYGYFGDNWFAVDTPQDLVELLPDVRDKEAFLPLFTGKITEVKELKEVGRATVDTNNFRISLEIAEEQSILTEAVSLDDLPEGDKSLAVQSQFTATASTSFAELFSADDITLSHDTLFSIGRTYFQMDGAFSDNAGYELSSAALRHDFVAKEHELTAFAGILQSRGLRFARSLDFFGLRVESNNRLLFRDPLLQASQIEIFLPTRSRVEIFRNASDSGRLLYSDILSFGTKQIDTRSFPAGSYDVEIVITEDDGTVTRETRPFTKTRGLAPVGKPEVNFEIGTVRDDLDTMNSILALASYRARIKDWVGCKVSLAATSDDFILEGELSTETHTTLAGEDIFIETGWSAAMDDRMSLAGLGAELSITDTNSRSFTLFVNKTFDRNANDTSPGNLGLSGRESINASVSTPIKVFGKEGRLNLSGEWSDSSTSGSSYRYGPSVTFNLVKNQSFDLDMDVELVNTDQDKRAIVSFKVDRMEGAWKASSEMIARSIGSESAVANTSSVTFNGQNSDHEGWRKNTNATLNARFDPISSNEAKRTVVMDADVDYKGKWVKASGFVNTNLTEGTDRIGGEIASTLLWTEKGGLKASPKNINNSGALLGVKLNGKPGTRIGIAVNGSPRAYGNTGETVYLSLPIYKTSTITAFDATESGAVTVKEKEHTITAFPGNVFFKEFSVRSLVIVLGQLFDFNNNPMNNTRFTMEDEVFYTEEDGLFSIEIPYDKNQSIQFITADQTCNFALPDIDEDEILVEMGNINCDKKPED